MKKAIRYFLNENARHRASSLGRRKAEKHSDKANFDKMNRIFREAIRTDLPKGNEG
jgi:hypothetical protein